MFWRKYKKPSSGEIRVPGKTYDDFYLVLPFRLMMALFT
jgi:hypothetical protein